ncbi:spore coat protein [Oceanobacillus bengalensis]|uniref:Spore coat protein n=1 Tax=Oceanobacillus bengalensis TaxID=1435466 RepID=A0A494YY12_9BACI|nr:spore coat protein [Oceanobacillus bengalensis]RKQ15058.1 spore coat protein [Oceanobacillus bengalensis]
MSTLPSVDLGLMAEHLSTHEGMINKLKVYHINTTNPDLKSIIALQINVMMSHVRVMLFLINPDNNEYVEVPDLNMYDVSNKRADGTGVNKYNDKWIALEAHAGAKLMSNANYTSALLMKNRNVRNAHVEMALQQLEIQKRYSDFINRMGWSFVPHADTQEQVKTYQHFQHLLNN